MNGHASANAMLTAALRQDHERVAEIASANTAADNAAIETAILLMYNVMYEVDRGRAVATD